MERGRQSTETISNEAILQRLVEDGVADAAKKYGADDPKLAVVLEALELAASMPASFEDFDWAIVQREQDELQMMLELRNKPSVSGGEGHIKLREHRLATAQLAECRDVLLASKIEAGELPQDTEVNPHAVMRYHTIVSQL